MLAIKNNLMAANAARHLGETYDALATSVERLSSGQRINTAKDDAAGLAVRELMRADVAVMKQGARNAQDAISMLQTMEGAMSTIGSLLTRMKELAEQAATGSYSDDQRTIMDQEFDELSLEITRIAGSPNFNGVNLLNSASNSVQIVFGSADDAITVYATDVTATGLGINALDIKTDSGALTALGTLTSAISDATSDRAAFGAKMKRLESTVEVLNIQAENLLAAESRISDVDVATEMSEMTRTQVLANAGVAMLAQANMMPQMALTLLR